MGFGEGSATTIQYVSDSGEWITIEYMTKWITHFFYKKESWRIPRWIDLPDDCFVLSTWLQYKWDQHIERLLVRMNFYVMLILLAAEGRGDSWKLNNCEPGKPVVQLKNPQPSANLLLVTWMSRGWHNTYMQFAKLVLLATSEKISHSCVATLSAILLILIILLRHF